MRFQSRNIDEGDFLVTVGRLTLPQKSVKDMTDAEIQAEIQSRVDRVMSGGAPLSNEEGYRQGDLVLEKKLRRRLATSPADATRTILPQADRG